MVALIDRDYRILVDRLSVTELDVAFKAKRTLKKEPNTCQINIFNLSPDQRRQMEERAVVAISIEAGYRKPKDAAADRDGATRSLIFAGDCREIETNRDGADLVTTIGSGDGEKKHRHARVNRSYGPGTSIKRVIEDCAAALGVGVGNLSALGRVEFPKAGAVFPCGTVLSGNAAIELDGVLRSAGLEYSIQNGALQILTRGQALAGTAVVLSEDTGMIGTPSISSDGTARAACLMVPDIFPGRLVRIVSERFTGIFRVETAEYAGDTRGEDWTVEIEAKEVKGARVAG